MGSEKKFSRPNQTHIMALKTSNSFIRKAHPSFIKKPVFFLNIKKIQYHNIGYVLDIPSSSYFGYARDSSLPLAETPACMYAALPRVVPVPVPPGGIPPGGRLRPGRGKKTYGACFAPPLKLRSLVKSNDFIFTAHSLHSKGIIHNQSTLQNYQSSKDNEYTWRPRTDFVASLAQSHKALSPSISAAGESKSELFSQEFGENMVKHKPNYNGSMASNNKQNALSLSATNWNPSMYKFIQWLPQNSSTNTAGLFIFENTTKNSVPEGWLGVSLKTLHQKPTPISSLSSLSSYPWYNPKRVKVLPRVIAPETGIGMPTSPPVYAGHSHALPGKALAKVGYGSINKIYTFKEPSESFLNPSLNIEEGLEGSKNKVKIKPIFMKWFKLPNIYLANSGISTIKKNDYRYKKKCNWFNTNHENISLNGWRRQDLFSIAQSTSFSEVQFHTPDIKSLSFSVSWSKANYMLYSRRYVYSPFVNPPLAIRNVNYLYPTVNTVSRYKVSKATYPWYKMRLTSILPSALPGRVASPPQDEVRLMLPDRKSTRLNSSHSVTSRMPSSA